jgi:hypothetical protein
MKVWKQPILGMDWREGPLRPENVGSTFVA